MPNPDTVLYDHSCAVSRGKRMRELGILLHAILQRHHPNGCEVPESAIAALDNHVLPALKYFENSQRGTLIVASMARPDAE